MAISEMQKFVNKINNRLRSWYDAGVYDYELKSSDILGLEEYSQYFGDSDYYLSTKKLNELKEKNPEEFDIVKAKFEEIDTLKKTVKTVDPVLYKANQKEAIEKYLMDLDIDTMLINHFLEDYNITGYSKNSENIEIREKLGGTDYRRFKDKLSEFGSVYNHADYTKARELLNNLKENFFSRLIKKP